MGQRCQCLYYKVIIKVLICICNKESFGFFISVVHKMMFGPKLKYKVGYYMVSEVGVPSEGMEICQCLCFIMFIFPTHIRIDVVTLGLVSKTLSSFVPSITFTLTTTKSMFKRSISRCCNEF